MKVQTKSIYTYTVDDLINNLKTYNEDVFEGYAVAQALHEFIIDNGGRVPSAQELSDIIQESSPILHFSSLKDSAAECKKFVTEFPYIACPEISADACQEHCDFTIVVQDHNGKELFSVDKATVQY